jgi:hypothetical protein
MSCYILMNTAGAYPVIIAFITTLIGALTMNSFPSINEDSTAYASKKQQYCFSTDPDECFSSKKACQEAAEQEGEDEDKCNEKVYHYCTEYSQGEFCSLSRETCREQAEKLDGTNCKKKFADI